MTSPHDYAAHILGRIVADVDFLEAGGHLRASDAASIRQTLAAAAASASASASGSRSDATASASTPVSTTASPAASLQALSSKASAVSSRFAHLAVSKRAAPSPPHPQAQAHAGAGADAPAIPPAPKEDLARAVWAYTPAPGADDELGFDEGDTLVIVERTSADWWKGYRRAEPGSTPRLFPANYVEAIAVTSAQTRILPPAYAGESEKTAAYTSHGRLIPTARFSSGGPSTPAVPSQPDGGGPSSGSAPAMSEEERKKKEGLKRFGNTMAHGAAGGVGFGIGAGLVNAIF